jgi:hypothetical protein
MIRGAKNNGLPYEVNEMTQEDFFISKHYQVPLEATFQKQLKMITVKLQTLKFSK